MFIPVPLVVLGAINHSEVGISYNNLYTLMLTGSGDQMPGAQVLVAQFWSQVPELISNSAVLSKRLNGCRPQPSQPYSGDIKMLDPGGVGEGYCGKCELLRL